MLNSLFSDIIRHHACIVAYIFHQLFMIMIGAAACAAEHVEFRAVVSAHDVEEMVVDAVQQVETLKALLLERVAVTGTSIPRSNDVQPDRSFRTLSATAQVAPFDRQEFDEYGRCVEYFFLFHEIHLFIPEVERFDDGVSRRVCELFQSLYEAEIKKMSHALQIKELIIKELKGFPGVGFRYFTDDAFGFGVHADELAFGDDDFAACLF